MQRILIMGGPGAGKSRLARELGARLGLEVVHLDAATGAQVASLVHWQEARRRHP